MSHSNDFWAEVERHCPSYRKLDAQLREMWKVVPRWAASFNFDTNSDHTRKKYYKATSP
jgi:hypothetical protein